MNSWTLLYETFEPDQEGLRDALCLLSQFEGRCPGMCPCVSSLIIRP